MSLEIGQQYKEFFKGNAGLTPERYMRYLVSSSGPNIRAQLKGLPSASSPSALASAPVSASSVPVSSPSAFVPVSASSVPVSVLPTETEHTYKQKRKVLVKSIREIVNRMLGK